MLKPLTGGKCNSRPGVFNHPLCTRGEGVILLPFPVGSEEPGQKETRGSFPGSEGAREVSNPPPVKAGEESPRSGGEDGDERGAGETGKPRERHPRDFTGAR